MKLVPLTRGLFARVDDEDYLRVMEFRWRAIKDHNTWYARASNRGGPEPYMHAFIMGTPRGKETHHKDRNGLNNEKTNLKIVSRAEHARIDRCQFRRVLGKNSSTGLLGVGKPLANGTWPAHIKQDGHTYRLGAYSTKEEAARARDAKARELGWPEEGMNYPNDIRPRLRPVLLRSTNKTGARGVSIRSEGIFHASVSHNKIEYHVGFFNTCREASLARDAKARELGIPETKMNFPI